MYLDEYTLSLQRTCCHCGCRYTIGEAWEHNPHYFPKPYDYYHGCHDHCLSCWLAPSDDPVAEVDDSSTSVHSVAAVTSDGWPYEVIYPALCEGRLSDTFQWFLEQGCQLAIMPIARLQVDRTITFPSGHVFYPAGYLDLSQLNIVLNDPRSASLAEVQSEASKITEETLSQHPLVVFPFRTNWTNFRRSSHKEHLELIRFLSESVDRDCLDFARYRACNLEPIEDLPSRAGQVYSNHMMAGAAIHHHATSETRIIGGAAFTHYVTIGLGMSLDQYEWESLPQDGEVGHIANQALALFSQLLEANSPTSKYVQAMSLFEFLAYPDQYEKFERVKKVISRYLAPMGSREYQRVLGRFSELGGKHVDHPSKKRDDGKPVQIHVGYRSRIVHLGRRLEQIVPDHAERIKLFLELESYMRPVIDHMIAHSTFSFEDYAKLRSDSFHHVKAAGKRLGQQDDNVPF